MSWFKESKVFPPIGGGGQGAGNQYKGNRPGDIPDWSGRFEYDEGREVRGTDGNYYRCVIGHIASNNFLTDVGNGLWLLFGGMALDNDRQVISIDPDGVTLRLSNGEVAGVPIPDSTVDLSSLGQNTWDMTGVAFVDPVNGDDSLGVVGDGNKPFRSINAANSYSSIIYCLPGMYNGNIDLKSKTYHFYPGAILDKDAKLRDAGARINAVITGNLKCGYNSYGIELSGNNSKVFATVESFEDSRSIAFAIGANSILTINAKRAHVNCNNGGLYACTARNRSEIRLNFTEHCSTDFWLVANRYGGKFTINTPILVTTDSSIFGNTAKAIINDQGLGSNIYNINVGFYKQTHPFIPVTFGVEETALLFYVTADPGERSIFNFKGNFDAGIMSGIGTRYYVSDGLINFEGTLRSDSFFLDTFESETNGSSNVTFNFKNSKLEGGGKLGAARIGSGKHVYFEYSTIYASNISSPAVINYDSTNPSVGAPDMYMYNGGIEHINNALVFICDDTTATMNFYFTFSMSSEANYPGATEPWGPTFQIAGFTVPKIELS